MLPATRRSGLVQMNQFEAQATWGKVGNESIVIRFISDLLSSEKITELKRFRSRTQALVLQVPGCHKRQATIVGYNIPNNAFYLAWVNSARAPGLANK
jgi:hypothetical protein